jgi:hypothetical protein
LSFLRPAPPGRVPPLAIRADSLDCFSAALGCFNHAASKPHAIRFKTPQQRLPHILGLCRILDLRGGSNCGSSATRRLNTKILRKAATPIVDNGLICFVHEKASMVEA